MMEFILNIFPQATLYRCIYHLFPERPGAGTELPEVATLLPVYIICVYTLQIIVSVVRHLSNGDAPWLSPQDVFKWSLKGGVCSFICGPYALYKLTHKHTVYLHIYVYTYTYSIYFTYISRGATPYTCVNTSTYYLISITSVQYHVWYLSAFMTIPLLCLYIRLIYVVQKTELHLCFVKYGTL